MISRPLLLSTIVFAMTASPALTQSTPRTPPPPASLEQMAARASQAPDMRSALRAFGLDRQSANFKFTKGAITAERATFSALVYSDGIARRATLENLVITRETTRGPDFGKFTVEGRNLVDGAGMRIGTFSASGVRGNSVTRLLRAWDEPASNLARSAGRAPGGPLYADNLMLTDVTRTSTPPGQNSTVSVRQMTLSHVVFNGQDSGFNDLTLEGLAVDQRDLKLTVAKLALSDANASLQQLRSFISKGPNTGFDVGSISFGGLAVEGLVAGQLTPQSRRGSLTNMSLANLKIGKIDAGTLENFSFAGLELDGTNSSTTWRSTLGRFALTGINLRVLEAFGSSISRVLALEKAANRRAGEPTIVPTPTRSPKLAEILTGGPLDGGINTIDIADFSVAAGIYNFTLDRIGSTQSRNNEGIITQTDLLPIKMRFSWTAPGTGRSGGLLRSLAGLNSNEIVLRLTGKSRFSPETDVLNIEDTSVELEEWGRLNYNLSLVGVDKFMKETDLDSLLTTPKFDARARASDPRSALSGVLGPLGDIKLKEAAVGFTDLGGINNVVRLNPSRLLRQRSSDTDVVMTAEQVRAQRLVWSKSLRDEIGDKSKSLLLRRAGLMIARWLEGGGQFDVGFKPSAPIAFRDMETAFSGAPEALGVRFNNTPAPIAVQTNTPQRP